MRETRYTDMIFVPSGHVPTGWAGGFHSALNKQGFGQNKSPPHLGFHLDTVLLPFSKTESASISQFRTAMKQTYISQLEQISQMVAAVATSNIALHTLVSYVKSGCWKPSR